MGRLFRLKKGSICVAFFILRLRTVAGSFVTNSPKFPRTGLSSFRQVGFRTQGYIDLKELGREFRGKRPRAQANVQMEDLPRTS